MQKAKSTFYKLNKIPVGNLILGFWDPAYLHHCEVTLHAGMDAVVNICPR